MEKKFLKLERKIERNERSAHPSYSASRIQYIAKARAGEVARVRQYKKAHHCNMCGVLH